MIDWKNLPAGKPSWSLETDEGVVFFVYSITPETEDGRRGMIHSIRVLLGPIDEVASRFQPLVASAFGSYRAGVLRSAKCGPA